MTTITATSEMSKLFSDVHAPTPVVDERGKRLGTFVPEVPDQKALRARVAREINPEELARTFERERGQGITTEELLKKLQALETAK